MMTIEDVDDPFIKRIGYSDPLYTEALNALNALFSGSPFVMSQ